MTAAPRYDIVVPTVGRPSLRALLEALAAAEGPRPERVLVVDDGAGPSEAPPVDGLRVEILPGPRRGPAAARNVGWRAPGAEWVAFLDDDVVPTRSWPARLVADLDGLPGDVAGSQGTVVVPLPRHRRPTDWERNVAGLGEARWATADMAYRRDVLAAVGGFDERFRRAYREDAELALRVQKAGYRLVCGRRAVEHPVRRAGRLASVAAQRGNADDVLIERLHPGWRDRPGEPEGRRSRHLATAAAAAVAASGLLLGRRRLAAAALGLWAAGTGELAWARIAPGPRNRPEVATMLATSVLIPPVASLHWLRGLVRWRAVRPAAGRPAAVLLDRDGTLVRDVPYNGDPERVVPMPGAREALDRLRSAGVPIAVVSNQSGIGRGLLTTEQVEAVNRRIEELLGPLGPWFVCPHAPDDGCGCRKPAGGMVLRAAAALGVEPDACALVGDVGSDVEAARAAGARAVLVPNERTRPEEVEAAPEVAPDLTTAVELLLGGRR